MSALAYELTLLGATLSNVEAEAIDQSESVQRLLKRWGGVEVDVWSYSFATLEAANNAVSDLRRTGLDFTAEIRTV